MPVPEEALEAVGIAAGFVDDLTGTNVASSMKEGVAALNDLHGGVKYPANPHLIDNGHAEADGGKAASPKCSRYFTWRKAKKFGGGAVNTVGNIGAAWTYVNVGGIARHGRAEAKTLAHLYRYRQMAKQVRQSEYLTRLLQTVIIMKTTKAATQGGKLGASCIPNPIAQAFVGAAVSAGGSVTKRLMASAVAHCAVELHWRAFQEGAVAGAIGGGGSGPAMRIVRELFGQIFRYGEADWTKADRYISEPAGWMVIQDKLNLV